MDTDITFKGMPQFQKIATQLIEALITPARLKRDLFISILLTIMEDSDFLLINEMFEPISIVDYIVARNMAKSDINEALFILNGFPEPVAKIITCPIGDALLIIATIPQIYQETYSYCFPLNNFIELSELGVPKSLSNLSKLNITYRNEIIVPLKSTILNFHQYPSGNLSGLPDDIMHQIILNLSLRDLLNLSETCKRFHRIVTTDSVWYRLCKRDFPDINKTHTNNWLEIYKEVYATTNGLKHVKNMTENVNEFEIMSDYLRTDARWEVIL